MDIALLAIACLAVGLVMMMIGYYWAGHEKTEQKPSPAQKDAFDTPRPAQVIDFDADPDWSDEFYEQNKGI